MQVRCALLLRSVCFVLSVRSPPSANTVRRLAPHTLASRELPQAASARERGESEHTVGRAHERTDQRRAPRLETLALTHTQTQPTQSVASAVPSESGHSSQVSRRDLKGETEERAGGRHTGEGTPSHEQCATTTTQQTNRPQSAGPSPREHCVPPGRTLKNPQGGPTTQHCFATSKRTVSAHREKV